MVTARTGLVDPVTCTTSMTIKAWLDSAIQDAERRGMLALRPMLETLARSTSALRSADWNGDPTGETDTTPSADAR